MECYRVALIANDLTITALSTQYPPSGLRLVLFLEWVGSCLASGWGN